MESLQVYSIKQPVENKGKQQQQQQNTSDLGKNILEIALSVVWQTKLSTQEQH